MKGCSIFRCSSFKCIDPLDGGVKNELEVHCVVAVLPLKCSHQLEPIGSPISDSALRGQYMMFKQESGVCVDPT